MNLRSLFKGKVDLLLLVAQSTIGFLFLPYLLSFVDIELYGEVFLIQSSAVFFQLFYNLGYTNTITSYADDWQLKEVYFEQVFKVLLLLIVKLILFLFFIYSLSVIGLLTDNIFQYTSVVLVLSLGNVLKDIFDVVQRMRNSYRNALILGLTYVVLETMFKTFYLNSQAFSAINYLALITLIKVIFYVGLLFNLIIWKCNVNVIRFSKQDITFFKYGFNWAVANGMGKISSYIDKPLISSKIGMETLGYYALASKIVGATAQFRTMLKNLWIYDALNQFPDHKDMSIKKLFRPGLVVLLIAIFLCPFYIYKSLNEWNIEVITYVLFFAIIEVFWYLYLYSSLAPVYYKMSSSIPRIQFVSFTVYFMVLFLVPLMGIYAVFLAKLAQLVCLIRAFNNLENKLKNNFT